MESTSSFIDRYGHIPQYVKMGDALPLMDASTGDDGGGNKYCIVPFRTLLNTLLRRFVRVGNDERPPPKRSTKDDILIFTNHVETPSLFSQILKQYQTPSPLSHTAQQEHTPPDDKEYGWTKIFSAVMRRSSHRFHVQDEAWLGQVSGSRLWFLLPPSTSKDDLRNKPPACEYLYSRESLPPGEVVYLPADGGMPLAVWRNGTWGGRAVGCADGVWASQVREEYDGGGLGGEVGQVSSVIVMKSIQSSGCVLQLVLPRIILNT